MVVGVCLVVCRSAAFSEGVGTGSEVSSVCPDLGAAQAGFSVSGHAIASEEEVNVAIGMEEAGKNDDRERHRWKHKKW